ncbi:uncharacterized protein LOC126737595 [Anthonomus grandis grandis]|uniref:uncharacterized protein LOC126737595 n=1 Tax=Anthonomus grandis grandis TaxID=2921223 RepID=UPI0021663ED8|nr:uncharacterized protein LOC126737595 [Anthonomus grandis grandis]
MLKIKFYSLFLIIISSFIAISANKPNIQENDYMAVKGHISGVTNLVTEALQNMATGHNNGHKPKISPLITGFLKLLGFDPNNIVTIALNGVIFLAQMMGSLILRKPSEKLRMSHDTEESPDISMENPFDWIWQNQEIANRVSLLTSKDLSENVLNYIKENSQNEETACVQLLICKISPFIWKMQDALTKENSLGEGYTSVLFHFIPTREELKKQSEICEKRFPFCN